MDTSRREHACNRAPVVHANARTAFAGDPRSSATAHRWTTGIITQLTCRKPKGLRFWTAWSDPAAPRRRLARSAGDDSAGRSQLALRQRRAGRAGRRRLHLDSAGDGRFARSDDAFSLVLSPEDVLLNMTLGVSASGRRFVSRGLPPTWRRQRCGVLHCGPHRPRGRLARRPALDGRAVSEVLQSAEPAGRPDGRLRGVLGR